MRDDRAYHKQYTDRNSDRFKSKQAISLIQYGVDTVYVIFAESLFPLPVNAGAPSSNPSYDSDLAP